MDGNAEFRLLVASDLHMQQTNKERVEANPLMYYQPEILSAFVNDVTGSGVDILILTGDITNHGRTVQHDLMIDLLRDIENKGTNVYVLPGNHDIGEITPQMFAELYADFGYSDAFSRDDFSLSYSLLIRDHLLLMLDTNGYSGNHMTAFLTEQTLKWMDQQLSVAKKYGYPVLVFGHYPLLTGHVTPFEGKEEAVRLLHDYNVPLYICGHMHLRNVVRFGAITELVVDQIVSSPCAYASITMTNDTITYLPQRVDVAKWAKENGIDDPRMLNFDDFQTAITDEALDLTIDALIGEQKISKADKALMVEFFRLFRHALAEGTMYRDRNTMKQHSGYAVFMRYAGNTSYGRWIPSVLETIQPYGNGFVLKNGDILLPDADH